MYMAKNINYKLIIKACRVLRSRATQTVLSQCRNDYMSQEIAETLKALHARVEK